MIRMHVDLPADLMQDQVNVLARDGVVRDGDFRPTKERLVARFVRCLIVANGRSRLPNELLAMAGQETAQVLIGPEPKLQEGYVLVERTTGARYIVARPQAFPSRHAPAFQIAALQEDGIGPVPT